MDSFAPPAVPASIHGLSSPAYVTWYPATIVHLVTLIAFIDTKSLSLPHPSLESLLMTLNCVTFSHHLVPRTPQLNLGTYIQDERANVYNPAGPPRRRPRPHRPAPDASPPRARMGRHEPHPQRGAAARDREPGQGPAGADQRPGEGSGGCEERGRREGGSGAGPAGLYRLGCWYVFYPLSLSTVLVLVMCVRSIVMVLFQVLWIPCSLFFFLFKCKYSVLFDIISLFLRKHSPLTNTSNP